MQRRVDRFVYEIIDGSGIGKADFHFRGMHIDVNFLRIGSKIKNRERESVLHQICPVTLLQTFGKNVAFQNSSVYKKDLISSCRPPSEESAQTHGTVLHIHGNHRTRDFPAVNPVDQLLLIAAAGRMEFFLLVHPVMKRDVRMRKREVFHQICDIAGFRLRSPQKFPAYRHIVKKIRPL